jgi:RND family efflux transporter MFP subunit
MVFSLILMSFSCNEGQRSWLSRFFKGGGSAVPVAVENVVVEEKAVTIVLPITLSASEQVEVRLPNEAHIERVFVKPGDVVKEGDVLCRLSAEDYILRLAALRAEMKEQQSNLEKNTYFLRNRDRLLEEGRITQDQYDALEAEVDQNESAIEKLRTQIAEMEVRTGEVEVKSPISGVIQARLASPGLVITENKPLFVITRINPIAATFSLAPYEARTVKAGMPVTIRFRDLPGEVVSAKIDSVGAKINPETSRFDVRVLLPNPNGVYKLGMVGQVEFESAEKQKFFTVSDEAIITDSRRHFVYTVSMGKAHKIPVKIREIKDGKAQIVEGLMDSDIVVVKGKEQLKEGAVVDIWR